ncbi:MAG: branched-chain amino acid ABC transporter permease [Promethearchaeota archaeon]|nr:MAG: branched-chain amino acid ABC transporter permease [Candidatus Lokiarchaeota archaeon]
MVRLYILKKNFKDFWIRLPKTFKHSIKSIPSAVEGFKNRLTTFSGGLTLFCLIILLTVPLFTTNDYYLGIFIMAFIYSIYAASWDFMTGYTGLVSFGHAIFLGLAGYGTSAALRFGGYNWFVALLFGSFLSVVIGVLIAIPSLRLKGPYLALTMLSISMIFWYLLMMGELSEIWPIFGSEGISRVYPLSPNPVIEYLVIFILMILSLGIMKALGNSKFGKVLNSIRDDEKGAEASGINISKYKILSFTISAFFAGIAGGLFAMHNYGVDPGRFQPLFSFYPIIMVAIGGLATISGGALGAFIFMFLNEILLEFAEAAPLFVFSIILILIIRFAERGIMRPAIERLRLLWDVLIGR